MRVIQDGVYFNSIQEICNMTRLWASNEEAEAKGELRCDILINSELQESLYLNISLVKRD